MRTRLGVSPDSLQPAEAARQSAVPILVAGGTKDAHATPAEVQRIHANAPEPKDLWMVEGAAHQDLHAFDEDAYHARVLGWLAEALEERD